MPLCSRLHLAALLTTVSGALEQEERGPGRSAAESTGLWCRCFSTYCSCLLCQPGSSWHAAPWQLCVDAGRAAAALGASVCSRMHVPPGINMHQLLFSPALMTV